MCEFIMHRTTELIATYLGRLRQMLSLLGQIDDVVFTSCPQGPAPHRVGTSIYDQANSLWSAYRTLSRQWKLPSRSPMRNGGEDCGPPY
jgi:hypothetical protein